MGYLSKVRGAIGIIPAPTEVEVYSNKVLRKFVEGTIEYAWPDLVLGPGFGTIEPATTDEYKAYELLANLEEIVLQLPGRKFVGIIEVYGEEDGDIWGLIVKDGKVRQIEPKIVWPED